MGNAIVKNDKTFDKKELAVMECIFQGLASRSPSKKMDKATFNRFFGFPGMFGERLFNLFDEDHDGWVAKEEFICGMETYTYATTENKIRLLFKLYDLADDYVVSIREMKMMLYSLTQLPFLIPGTRELEPPPGASHDTVPIHAPGSPRKHSAGNMYEAKPKTVDGLVTKAYQEHDSSQRGKLDYDGFKTWVESSDVIKFLDFTFTKEYLWKQTTASSLEADMDGTLITKGKWPGRLHKYYCVMTGSFLYKFDDKDKEMPKEVIFLDGMSVQGQNLAHEKKDKLFGFQLHAAETKWTFYTNEEGDRSRWMKALQVQSRSANIANYYSIGRELGEGLFATVHEAVHLKSGKMRALKLMDKSKIDEEEMEGVRCELTIMSLVNHPHLMRKKEIFETDRYIYIIMELIEGGDLMTKMINDQYIEEWVVRKITRKLLSALKYLHSRGIVHRDVKPENILVRNPNDDDCSDIMLTDYGLSTFLNPFEKMDVPVGTLMYFAPEILTCEGYSYAVDVWATGVLTYAMLSGLFPFMGKTTEETTKLVVEGDLKWHGTRWDAISDEAKDFISKVLVVNPKKRLSVEEACAHPWFTKPLKKIRRNSSNISATPPTSPTTAKQIEGKKPTFPRALSGEGLPTIDVS